MSDHYEALGISREATADEIKKAHRRLVVEIHPDKGGDPDAFIAVQLAYETLSDTERRRRYDSGEPEPTDPMAQVFTYLGNVFQGVIPNTDPQLFYTDIIGKMREYIANDKAGTRTQIDHWNGRISFLEKVKGRLSYKGTRTNILTGMLDQELAALRGAILQGQGKINVLTLADEMLEDYTFKVDRPTPEAQYQQYAQQAAVLGQAAGSRPGSFWNFGGFR